jgi:hypothetical protein
VTLDERLGLAREDYRRFASLTSPKPTFGSEPELGRQRSTRLAFAAVLAVVVVFVGSIAWWTQHDGASRDLDVISPSPTSAPESSTTAVEDTTRPAIVTVPFPGAVTQDSAIEISPRGPFQHGQQVTVSMPVGYSRDAWERPPRQCAAILESAGSVVSETCDPLLDASRSTDTNGGRETATVTLSRSVFTSSGFRDCADPGVVCRLLVQKADGETAASERLAFSGATVEPANRLALELTGQPNEFVVTAAGVGQPEQLVQVCAFGKVEPQRLQDGRELWGFGPADAGPLQDQQCAWSTYGINIETLDLNRVRIKVQREVFGYGGWIDCVLSQCFIKAASTAVPAASSAPAAALLPIDHNAQVQPRPQIAIKEPGPYRPGQQLTVELKNLPADYATWIGVCHVDGPWACGYEPSTQGTGNRLTTFVLRDNVAGCGPEICYLEIDSRGEGVPPLATAPLPIIE